MIKALLLKGKDQVVSDIPRIVLLLLPGFITSAGLLALAAGYIVPLQPSITFFSLNFIQTFALGITIAKYGSDFLVYAKLLPGQFALMGNLMKNRSIPLSIAYSIFLSIWHGNLWMLLLILLVPLEVYSIIVIAELNLNRKHLRTLVINLLGYPLILGLIWLFGRFNSISIEHIFFIFVLSSICKAIVSGRYRIMEASSDCLSTSFEVPLQQVLNFLLYRMDQVIIMLGLLGSSQLGFMNPSQYLLMAKFPEVTAGIVAALTPVLLPLFLGNQKAINRLLEFRNPGLLLGAILGIICFAILIIFLVSGRRDGQYYILFLPFLFQCILILPANLITYMIVRSSGMNKINLWSFVSIVFGIIVFLLFLLRSTYWIFASLVPLQIGIYVLIALFYHKLRRHG